MPRLIFTALAFFCTTLLTAQAKLLDSLIALEKNASIHDTVKIKLCGDIGWELLSSDINRALSYANKELQLSQKLNRLADEAQAESDIGSIYNRKAVYDTALIHYFLALKIRQHLKQPIKIAGIQTNIATVYMRQNKFKEALDINFKTLKLFEEAGDETKQAIVLGNIANLYYELEQNKPALNFLYKSLLLARKTGHRVTEANVLVNIGGIMYEEGTLKDSVANHRLVDSALINFLKAEKIFLELKSNYNLAAVYNNIGRIYASKKLYKEAIVYYTKALETRTQLEDKFGIGLSNLNIGSIKYLLGQYNDALPNLEVAAVVFRDLRNFVNLKQAYGKMAEIYEVKGDYSSSLRYYQLYANYKDSVYTSENAEKMSEMQTRYETEKKDNEILKQKSELSAKEQESRKKNMILWFVSILAVLTVTTLLFYIRQKQAKQQLKMEAQLAEQKEIRAKAIIETEEKERIRIAKDLHDGVGQLLSAAKLNLSNLEGTFKNLDTGQELAFKNALSLVDDSVKEVRAVSHNMMPNTLLKQGLASAVREFITKIQNTPNLKVNLEMVGLNERLEQEKESVLYRVIQELVSNIIKHAKASQLTLQLIKHEKELSIMIEDNGIGFDASKINSFEGIGLKNIISRVEFINGNIHFDTEPGKGTRIIIDIPA